MADWGEEEILAQVMAQSQQEYLESLKQCATFGYPSPSHLPSTSAASASSELPLPGYSGGAGQNCHYNNSGAGHRS